MPGTSCSFFLCTYIRSIRGWELRMKIMKNEDDDGDDDDDELLLWECKSRMRECKI